MAIMVGSGKISVPRFSRWAEDNYRGKKSENAKGVCSSPGFDAAGIYGHATGRVFSHGR
jgi:hypothetical protein